MKFVSLLAIAVLSVSSVIAQIPPVYPPPDGEYYIFNVQYKRVFDDANYVIAEGNPIIGWPASMTEKFTNQQWLVETTDYTASSHKVTMRVLQTVQEDPSAGGYATNINGKIVHSKTGEAWTLQAVPESAEQFMIVDGNVAITFDDGTTTNWPQAQLTAEATNTNATNQRWIFVPVDQADTFYAENGI